jgi:hypothetical protein
LIRQPWNELILADEGRASARLVQRRIALRIRDAARIIALPALVAMVGGLIMFAVSTRPLPLGKGATAWVIASTPTIAFADLLNRSDLFAPNWWMSVGILALVALPGVNVTLILWENVRLRRWRDALAATGVLVILAAGALMARR